MRNFLCLLWLVWICSINVCLSIQWCVIIFLKTEQTPWETKTKQGNSNQMQFFLRLLLHTSMYYYYPMFATIVPPSEIALLFYSPWLGKFKKFKQFLRWAAANPKACTMLLLALAIKQKKIDGANITRRRRCWHLM